MAGPYDVHNYAGVAVAGDQSLDDTLRSNADRNDGFIVDVSTGKVVYTSPGYGTQREEKN